MAKKWMQKLKIKKGGLRRHLGVKKGQKISASKLAIKSSDDVRVRREKVLAKIFAAARKK
jgi:hypothetical protein